MKIMYIVGLDTIDYSDDAEVNQKYLDVIEKTLQAAYPNSTIEVELGEHSLLHVNTDENLEALETEIYNLTRDLWANLDLL